MASSCSIDSSLRLSITKSAKRAHPNKTSFHSTSSAAKTSFQLIFLVFKASSAGRSCGSKSGHTSKTTASLQPKSSSSSCGKTNKPSDFRSSAKASDGATSRPTAMEANSRWIFTQKQCGWFYNKESQS
jgi:hypothetical protein